MILGCQSDTIQTTMGNLHKEKIGIMVVVADIISILVITYFIGKIREINEEYLGLAGNLEVNMSDYTV